MKEALLRWDSGCEMSAHFTLLCKYSVSTKVALLVSSVNSLGGLDKGAPSGIWPDRITGKMVVLESLSLTLSALVGLISTSDLGMG